VLRSQSRDQPRFAFFFFVTFFASFFATFRPDDFLAAFFAAFLGGFFALFLGAIFFDFLADVFAGCATCLDGFFRGALRFSGTIGAGQLQVLWPRLQGTSVRSFSSPRRALRYRA
jgi:uncharacterized membrane protein YjjP (DUF1212 family)